MAKLTKKKIDAFYAALGRFVSEWAEVEKFLDLIVLVLARKKKPKLPFQLSGKIETIRSELRNSQSPHATTVMRLLDEVEALSETRHDYIHGSVMEHVVTRSTLTVALGRLLQPSHKPRRPLMRVTAAQISTTADRLREIGDALLDLGDALNKENLSHRSTVH